MCARDITRFWYYGICALVLVGARTTASVSGAAYTPTDTAVRAGDMVTVDLSPCDADGYWGDYARSFYVGGECATLTPSLDSPYRAGHDLEIILHDALRTVARPDMMAHNLWARMTDKIVAAGFENLDFKGNLGHSIERDMAARRYIESGADTTLGALGLFTFEPHIRLRGGRDGFKREDIYAFRDGVPAPL